MFEYKPTADECRFLPYVSLKQYPMHEFAEEAEGKSLYVLQCSTATEDVVPELKTNNLFHFALQSTCSDTGIFVDTDGFLGTLSHTHRSVHFWNCQASGQVFLRFQVKAEHLPFGIDNAYLDRFNPDAFLRVNYRAAHYTGDTLQERTPSPQNHTFKILRGRRPFLQGVTSVVSGPVVHPEKSVI